MWNPLDKYINKRLATFVAGQYSNINQNLLLNFLNSNGLQRLNPQTYDFVSTVHTIGAVYETTDIIMKKVYSSPLVIYKIKDKKKLQQSKNLERTDPVQSYLLKAQAIEEVDVPAISKLLDNPNPYQDRVNFIWTTGLVYLLTGNSFVYGNIVNNKPQMLYPIPDMNIITNDNYLDPILGYSYNFSGDLKAFEKDEIYHIKTGNPVRIDNTFWYLYGLSPLAAYLESIRTIDEAEKQTSKQMKNGGVFGILSPRDKEDQWTPAQRNALSDRIKEARISNDELTRIFPSAISLNWQQIGLSSADLQLIEQKKVSQQDIYRAYHVPFEYASGDNSTFNNGETSMKKLGYDAVAPVCNALSRMLTNFVGKPYGDYIIELDYTQLPEMAVNMKDVSDYVSKLVDKGILTRDEARTALKYGELATDVSRSLFYGNKLLSISNNTGTK